MTTNAIAGVGARFLRADAASSGTGFTAIAEINSISGPNKSRATIDVTSLDSAGGYREFIASFRDAGEITLEMNWTRDGYDQINDDFESDTAWDYQVEFPDTGNTTLDFTALVTALGSAIPLDDKITMSVTLKISGQVTLTS
jgi:predicted secreted protein